MLRILLKNGSIHTQHKNDYRLVSFGEYLLTAESGRSTPPVRTELDLGIAELQRGSRSPQLPAQARLKMATELHSRFAFPCATFVFAILALPLGLSNRRSGKGSGFTISILILLVYYVPALLSCVPWPKRGASRRPLASGCQPALPAIDLLLLRLAP